MSDKEWTLHKEFPGTDYVKEWFQAIKEVYELNKLVGGGVLEGKHRAVIDEGGLTEIYCDGFYMVPTIRGW